MRRTFRSAMLGALVTLGAAVPVPVFAQGYGLYEQGTCAMARGGAGVADPCDDGSAMFFNPAGLAWMEDRQLTFGGTIIAPRGQFVNDATRNVMELNNRYFPAPHAYYTHPINDRLVAGIGLFAPYGLTTDWPPESEGRFLGYQSLVNAVYFQPTVAYRVTDRFAIGGGLNITYLRVELHQRLDLSTQAVPGAPPGVTFGLLGVPQGTDFADVSVEGATMSAGFHLGASYKASDQVSFGARFLSGQDVEVDEGEFRASQIATNLQVRLPFFPQPIPIDTLLRSQFEFGAPLSAQDVASELPLPMQFVVGAAFRPSDRVKLFLDYQFTGWEAFDQLVLDTEFAPTRVIVEDYNNAHGVRVGVEYDWKPQFVVRGGFVANSAAAPDQTVTPNLPEAPRTQYAGGFGYRFSNRMSLDFAYLFLNQRDRRGRTTDGGLAVPTAAVNNGEFSFYANLAAVTFRIGF